MKLLKTKWMKRLVAVALAMLVFVGTLVLYSVYQNRTITIRQYEVTHAQIPAAFDGKRIVHLSDLHNKDFGDQLTDKVRALVPDIIVITGDWIGLYDVDVTIAKAQVSALVDIAPIYYVAGNHESITSGWNDLRDYMQAIGVTILHNSYVLWEEGDAAIQLSGIFAPDFGVDFGYEIWGVVDEEYYTVLLYHQPEYFERAAQCDVDLMLSGHTHGGQVRLPFIGALFAPDQGFFPQYDVGRFDIDNSTLIISQGLSESVYMRVLAPPEIVVIDLKSPS